MRGLNIAKWRKVRRSDFGNEISSRYTNSSYTLSMEASQNGDMLAQWNCQTAMVINKANRMLGLLRRNIDNNLVAIQRECCILRLYDLGLITQVRYGVINPFIKFVQLKVYKEELPVLFLVKILVVVRSYIKKGY